MSTRRPLVRVSGKTRQMAAGDKLPADCLPETVDGDMGSGDAAKGWLQIDRTTGKTWRLYVDNGIIGIEEA